MPTTIYYFFLGIPLKTNAEKQKAYRERLKKENPDKHEEFRVKHLKKVKENIKKKKESLTEKDKEEKRAKWKKLNAIRAEIKKRVMNTIQNKINNKKNLKKKIIQTTNHTS